MSFIGELNYFLGLTIKQTKDGIFIHQTKYTLNLLKWYGFENLRCQHTLMSSFVKPNQDEKGKVVDIKLYKGMIRSLLYLTISKPNVMYSACVRACVFSI
jgi:hypothetical protein